MKVIFFGSSNFCLPILDSLKSNFKLVSVVTKKGQTVEKYAQSHNIRFFTPANKEELFQLKNDISGLKPDLAIVADYGFIIPAEIFDIPPFKTLNIHFSKLPKFRGPSPVQYTLMMGEKSAWISIILMDEGLDTGDIIWQKSFDFAQDKEGQGETTGSLYNKLFNIASLSLPDVINKYVKNELKPQKQDHSHATYTKHLTRQDGYIPSELLGMAIEGNQPTNDQLSKWKLYNEILHKLPSTRYSRLSGISRLDRGSSTSSGHDAVDTHSSQTASGQLPTIIDHTLRALSPWPGLWTTVQIVNNNQITKRLKILKVHLEADNNLPLNYPSRDTKVVGNLNIPVRFVLDEVQLEGKKPVSWKQFTNGYPQFSFKS